MEQKITIKIGEREYDLKSKSPEQEEMIRKAADMLNRMVTSYQVKYPRNNTIDILSFVAINQCISNISLQKKMEDMEKEITELGNGIDDYLKNIGK